MEQRSCPVDVISMCSASGRIRPLRLRIEGDSRSLIRIDIDEVISVKEIPYVGAEAHIFLCRGVAEGAPCLVELKYSIRSHTWCLLGKIYD